MKVAIGVPTYNRRYLVELNAASLRSSSIPSGTALIVVDDCSAEYDVDYLRSIYPEFADIRRRSEKSRGASFANRDLMRRLLETDGDAVLLLDSDLLVSSNFLELGMSLLRDTDGFLSLFNTPNHPTIGARGPFVLKKSVGCAGTLWRRDLAAKVLAAVPPCSQWDWRFSDFLVKTGVEISVVRDSLVQHIGYSYGQNSSFRHGDVGVGFSDWDAKNAYRLTELLLTDSQAKFIRVQDQIDALNSRASLIERQLLISRFVRSWQRLLKRLRNIWRRILSEPA
jgi:glycosyltransferase involved in cell wall biosynthesis